MDKSQYLEKALEWANAKPVSSLKSVAENYEQPKAFKSTTSDETIQPDISYVSLHGAKHYLDIALKDENPQKLVTRWKLLSLMASMKRGKLHLLAPKGHKQFTQKLVNKYSINALIHSL